MVAYDPTGALGGLFAPAYIHGNPESEAAVQQWQSQNFGLTPEMVEQTRGPATTVTNPATGGMGQLVRGPGTTTSTPGSVDPAALRILAQGGKYDMNKRRDEIAKQVLANTAAAAPAGRGQPTGGFSGGILSPEYLMRLGRGYPLNWTNSDVPFATS